ncbi:M20/M25/M40 family metallo-hydrolase [Roseateles puraquae]|uniref:Peptidase M20 n=1 Tax=Roseateles puraquae TaxID=431059 RepID=A0A254NA01_9BURK|nr:M20/M25/M40 family metallo-hydrolase [Roseateles puraquae]MDG0853136.1 M20/M25/M40 family metallo-hydrolase [Roseateles puraquae]OWR02248.1 peptidase M20 [Roseateles puraquae]
MRTLAAAVLAALLTAPGLPARAQADDALLRAIYQELVEINTTPSSGDCTVAVKAMAARLKAGGFQDDEIRIVVPPGADKHGNLVARLRGSGAQRPLLQLAHVDVVEARREDWTRDPFKLVEEDGYFYARGSSDDKSMAAIYVANMIRFRKEGLKPARDLVLALTCGEETVPGPYNGVEYLLRHHRGLIDAELALNEGGGGALTAEGQPLFHRIQAGEKVFQSFQLEVTNKGGHSSVPVPDNAIYRLADGLSRLARFSFPLKLSPVTRAYFEYLAQTEKPAVAQDIRAILRDPPDPDAQNRLWQVSATYNASARTTCVATQLDAGHAVNALPQRAKAFVNCRILPGQRVEDVQATLERVLADAQIKVTRMGGAVEAPMPPMKESLLEAIKAVNEEVWPGVPVILGLTPGASDGRFLNQSGIWTYGVTGLFHPPGGSNAHGLNERLRVRSLFEGAEFQYRLVRRLAQP